MTPLTVIDCGTLNFGRYESVKINSPGIGTFCIQGELPQVGGSSKIFNTLEQQIEIDFYECSVSSDS
jgi:hypothetical protein